MRKYSQINDSIDEDVGLPIIDEDDILNLIEDDSFDNIDKFLNTEFVVEDIELPSDVSFDDLDLDTSSQFANNMDMIKSCIANKTVVMIYYTTKGGKFIQRVVEPHGILYATGTGNRLSVTYDRTAGDIRAFIIDNIDYFYVLDDTFVPKFVVQQGLR